MADKKKNKKILIVALVAIVVIVILYFVFSGSGSQKDRPGTDDLLSGGCGERAPGYKFPNHQPPRETEPTKSDGSPKTKITCREIDIKVMNVLDRALAGEPDAVWLIQNAQEAQTQFWMPQSGMLDDEAVWYTIRDFITSNFYR